MDENKNKIIVEFDKDYIKGKGTIEIKNIEDYHRIIKINKYDYSCVRKDKISKITIKISIELPKVFIKVNHVKKNEFCGKNKKLEGLKNKKVEEFNKYFNSKYVKEEKEKIKKVIIN